MESLTRGGGGGGPALSHCRKIPLPSSASPRQAPPPPYCTTFRFPFQETPKSTCFRVFATSSNDGNPLMQKLISTVSALVLTAVVFLSGKFAVPACAEPSTQLLVATTEEMTATSDGEVDSKPTPISTLSELLESNGDTIEAL